MLLWNRSTPAFLLGLGVSLKVSVSIINDRIDRAVRNNADWCEIVCGTHGSPGLFLDGMWINRGTIPRFYPNAQALTRDVPRQLDVIKELIDGPLPAGWALKDSFASLDLVPLGFTLLFEAQWIVLPPEKLLTLDATSANAEWKVVRSEDLLSEWEQAWRDTNGDTNPARIFLPALLDNPEVAFVAACSGQHVVAGAIGNRSEGVVGWSNFFAGRKENLRACASGSIAAISRIFPETAIVGYEEGAMLTLAHSLGFEALGPLRVWLFAAP